MNMTNKLVVLSVLSLLILPSSLSAHETRIYEIGGVEYEMVVGSRNEPVIVDDKTGVSLEIAREGKLFEGAQSTLQVEIRAGDTARTMSIEPIYGTPGTYRATYIATVPTTLIYRVFGTLEGVAFEDTFTCNPVGHVQSEEVTEPVTVTEGVTQTLKKGNFSCPEPKEKYGFPEPAPSSFTLQTDINDTNNVDANQTSSEEKGDSSLSLIALVLALLSVGLSIIAVVKSRRQTTIG